MSQYPSIIAFHSFSKLQLMATWKQNEIVIVFRFLFTVSTYVKVMSKVIHEFDFSRGDANLSFYLLM